MPAHVYTVNTVTHLDVNIKCILLKHDVALIFKNNQELTATLTDTRQQRC